MMDLIYLNDRFQYDTIKECLKKEFPNAQIEDASDDVHEYRFSITMPDEKRDEYNKFVLKTGLVIFSFAYQVGHIKGKIDSDAESYLKNLFESKKGGS